MTLRAFERRFVLISFILIGTWDACVSDSCNPVEQCLSSSVGTKVPDPKNCHNYYICIEDAEGNREPSDNVFECDFGYYFSDSYGRCEYGSCTNTCMNVCPLGCISYSYESYADPDSCNSFYTCYPNGATMHFLCPDDAPYYDGVKCSNNEFDCCDTCIPYCSNEYTETQDPYDCRSYYFCYEEGVPSEENHFQCPSGEYFDPLDGDCRFEEKRCESTCGNDNISTNSTEYSVQL